MAQRGALTRAVNAAPASRSVSVTMPSKAGGTSTRWHVRRLLEDAGAVVVLSVLLFVGLKLWNQPPAVMNDLTMDAKIVYQQQLSGQPEAPIGDLLSSAGVFPQTDAPALSPLPPPVIAPSLGKQPPTPNPNLSPSRKVPEQMQRTKHGPPTPTPAPFVDPGLDALLKGGQDCPADFAVAVAKQLEPWAESGIQMGMLDHLYCIRKQVARVSIHGGKLRQVNWQLNMDHNRLRSSFWLLHMTIDRAQKRGLERTYPRAHTHTAT